jgi:hypothetical protein
MAPPTGPGGRDDGHAEPARVAVSYLAQSARASKLPVQHRDQMTFARYDATIPVTIVLGHEAIEYGTRNLLQKSMKNDILMLHGFDLLSCPIDSQPTEPE